MVHTEYGADGRIVFGINEWKRQNIQISAIPTTKARQLNNWQGMLQNLGTYLYIFKSSTYIQIVGT